MSFSACSVTLSKPLSYIGFLCCVGYGLQKGYQDGEITMLIASMVILLFLFTLSFYSAYVKQCSTILSSDLATLLRAYVSVLFTTDLFTKEQIIGDMWDYLPMIIMVTMSIIYLMQSDSACDRSFLPLYMLANFFAQLYVAFKTDNWYAGAAAFFLCMAQNICQDDPYLGIAPQVWFNILAGSYCLAVSAKDKGGE